MKYPSQRNIPNGLRQHGKLLPVSLLVLLVTCGVLTFYYETWLGREVTVEVNQSLERVTSHAKGLLVEEISQYKRNLLFLHATPPIDGLTRARANDGIDPFDGTSSDQWKYRLETIFVSMLQNNPEIDQLRVIDINDDGMELIRVDKLSGKIEIVGEQGLQPKSDTDYFKSASNLHPQELYISQINLNREFGKLVFPYQPTIRLATPIFYEDGRRFGFVIMNVDASILLARFRKQAESEFEAVLTDDEGFYIYHPLENLRFSRDLDPSRKWDGDYQSQVDNNDTQGRFTELATGKRFLVHHEQIRLNTDDRASLNLYAMASMDVIGDLMWKRRATTYGFVVVVLLILLVILFLLQRSYRSKLQLSETRAEYEAIINGSSDAIIGMDLSGQITSWNDSATALLSVPGHHAIRQNIDGLKLFEGVVFKEQLAQVISDMTPQVLETRHKRVSGQICDISLTLSPIFTDDRTLAGVAAIARDITRQKEAEQRIRQANVELEDQVIKRTEELEVAHQKAVQASEMKSAFISNVSHEMRTPLNGIIGTLNLIRREPLSDDQRRYIGMTEASTSSLSVLINDILDLSKIEAGKLEFEDKPFDPLGLVEAVAQSSAVRTHEKGLEFILDTTELVHAEITGDANRLKQVLNNLISNAIKFTTEGRITLIARSSVDRDDMVRFDFEVHDTGVGIAPENRHRLFHAFSQEDNSVSSQFGGTGLGLSICKQLCQLMGGDINFEAEKGEGAQFFFHVRFAQNLCKEETIPMVLSDKTFGLLRASDEGAMVAEKIVRLFGGEVVDAHLIRSWLKNGKYDGDRLPDFLLIDSELPEVPEILDRLRALEISGKDRVSAVPVLLLVGRDVDGIARDQSGIIMLNHPLMRGELLKKLVGLTVGQPDEESDEDQQAVIKLASETGTAKPEENVAEKVATANADRPKAVVLIVDDNDINLAVARGFLGDVDAQLITARNGREALEALWNSEEQGIRVHCVLMDCQMPEIDGFEATKKIRNGDAGDSYKQVPIIAMTASAMSGERERCLAVGMSDYLTKPIVPDQLVAAVTRWLKVGQRGGRAT